MSQEASALPSQQAHHGLPAGGANITALSRDMRIDFLRGFVCVAFITAHFEAFSWFHMIFWERLGFFSGAEIFVLLSGFLTGIVHRRLALRPDGADVSLTRLWRRAGTLYLAYVALTFLVILTNRFTALDLKAVTTFTDRSSDITYRLIPTQTASISEIVHNVLLLRTTPHQVQILGLYAVLLGITPFVLILLRRGHWLLLLLLSLAAWAFNQFHPLQPTGALYEYAFPTLAWQLYFFMALIGGWYRAEVSSYLERNSRLSAVSAFGTDLRL